MYALKKAMIDLGGYMWVLLSLQCLKFIMVVIVITFG